MKIAIIGTRGIPNNYGGFEQFAEYISVELVNRGHEVTVYNSDKHIYQKNNYKGVQIIHKSDPENKLGTIGQFVYDFNCIIDTRSKGFDIILNLGYTSSSVWCKLFPKNSILITNMDGLEWKRTKFNKIVQKFLLYAEKLAVKNSHYLIADSLGIQSYLKNKYNVQSEYIAYGSTLFDNPNEEYLEKYKVEKNNYLMILARMEPENNIEVILDGIVSSDNDCPTLIFGNINNKFGEYLQNKFSEHKQIRFIGPEYNIEVLNNLRYHSKYYFHGHSVGGTNPSLLEAMASKAFIIANDNEFNKGVLQNNALYFKSSDDIKNILNIDRYDNRKVFIDNNYTNIEENFSWSNIIDKYEIFMSEKLQQKSN